MHLWNLLHLPQQSCTTVTVEAVNVCVSLDSAPPHWASKDKSLRLVNSINIFSLPISLLEWLNSATYLGSMTLLFWMWMHPVSTIVATIRRIVEVSCANSVSIFPVTEGRYLFAPEWRASPAGQQGHESFPDSLPPILFDRRINCACVRNQ